MKNPFACQPAAAAAITLFLCGITPGLFVAARAQMPSSTFRTPLVESSAAAWSYSGKSGYKNNSAPGETSVHHFEASAAGRATLGRATFLGYGAAFALNEIDSDDTVPAPARLGELSVNIGVTQAFSKQWRASLFVRPGYYGDMEHYTARALNAPAIALATYSPNEQLMWLFGVSVNPFSEYIVMPVASVRWGFAEGWALNLGFPRLGVTWQVSKALELSVHATAQGGGYRTTQAPGGAAAATVTDTARLSGTYVNYREIRVGSRATFKPSPKTSIALEAGWMADRRFDYYDRDYEIKGKQSAYVTVAFDVKM